jgi:prevent-host-death family protein
MIEVALAEAEGYFSKLVSNAAAGEELVILRNGEPIARIVPIERQKGRRVLGQYRGRIFIADDFDDPVDPETWE